MCDEGGCTCVAAQAWCRLCLYQAFDKIVRRGGYIPQYGILTSYLSLFGISDFNLPRGGTYPANMLSITKFSFETLYLCLSEDISQSELLNIMQHAIVYDRYLSAKFLLQKYGFPYNLRHKIIYYIRNYYKYNRPNSMLIIEMLLPYIGGNIIKQLDSVELSYDVISMTLLYLYI
jgi:hypothetical protein